MRTLLKHHQLPRPIFSESSRRRYSLYTSTTRGGHLLPPDLSILSPRLPPPLPQVPPLLLLWYASQLRKNISWTYISTSRTVGNKSTFQTSLFKFSLTTYNQSNSTRYDNILLLAFYPHSFVIVQDNRVKLEETIIIAI